MYLHQNGDTKTDYGNAIRVEKPAICFWIDETVAFRWCFGSVWNRLCFQIRQLPKECVFEFESSADDAHLVSVHLSRLAAVYAFALAKYFMTGNSTNLLIRGIRLNDYMESKGKSDKTYMNLIKISSECENIDVWLTCSGHCFFSIIKFIN